GGNHCCWWTAAEGEITDATPDAFKRYLNSERYPPALLRLSSPGGSLFGALELGLLVRQTTLKLRFATQKALISSPAYAHPLAHMPSWAASHDHLRRALN